MAGRRVGGIAADLLYAARTGVPSLDEVVDVTGSLIDNEMEHGAIICDCMTNSFYREYAKIY